MTDRAPRIEVHDDAAVLATAVGRRAARRGSCDAQAARRSEPQIALTGGTHRRRSVHRELARLAPGLRASTGRGWCVWWGDERFVAPRLRRPQRRRRPGRRSSTGSPLDPAKVHEMPATDDAGRRRRGRRDGVRRPSCASTAPGEFDVLMLGVGPGRPRRLAVPRPPALDVDDRIAVGVTDSPKPPPERVSLTFAAPQPRPVGVVPGQRRGEGRRRGRAPSAGDRPARHPRRAASPARARRSGSSTEPPRAVAAPWLTRRVALMKPGDGAALAAARPCGAQKMISPDLRRCAGAERLVEDVLGLGVGAALLHVGQVGLVGLDLAAPAAGSRSPGSPGSPHRGQSHDSGTCASTAKVTTERCSWEQK